jgi:YD repeat-containing protein
VHESTQDWSALQDAPPPKAASIAAIAEADLESETFEVAMQYDALGRVTSSTTPDGSETRSRYNEAGLLDAVDVRIRGAGVAAEGAWWRRSGQQVFDANGVFLPVSASDAFGGEYAFSYDVHRLHVVAVSDPLGNTASSALDYRVLQPELVTDANGNQQRAGVRPLERAPS